MGRRVDQEVWENILGYFGVVRKFKKILRFFMLGKFLFLVKLKKGKGDILENFV